jgi:GNAT superfamily N-acetyltransferase
LKSLFVILTSPTEVLRYVSEVQSGADTEKNALGFLPGNVYEEAAHHGRLFVAVTGDTRQTYLGHVLFGDKYPHGRIYQIFVSPSARGQGVGHQLLRHVVHMAEARGFLSLVAKVAADLPANAFYEAGGFETLKVREGGQTRNRKINIRVLSLDTPALFGYRERVSGLPLAEPVPTFSPVLTLDLNIFFDVAKRRPRSTYSGVILSAAFANVVQLTATEELATELKRTSIGESDTALEFASQMPTLAAPPEGIPPAILSRLAEIVFPERAKGGKLTIQDRSDLNHLAIAAHHNVCAFVTAEDALVAASSAVEDLLGLRVAHVKDLATVLRNACAIQTSLDVGFAEGDLRLSALNPSLLSSMSSIADGLELPHDVRSRFTAVGVRANAGRSLVVSLGDTVVAAAFWQGGASLTKAFGAMLVSNEDAAACEVAVDILLNELSVFATASGPARIQLTIPNLCLTAQRVALRCGYLKCKDSDSHDGQFQRLSVGGPITSLNWTPIRHVLKSVSKMDFPADLPKFRGEEMRINFQGEGSREYSIDLFDLETTLAPAVLLLPDRRAVLVPIQARFADDLLGTAEQPSLFPRKGVAILHERTYFCSPRSVNLFARGTIVVFYESGRNGGRQAATAIARVRDATVVSKRRLAAEVLQTGVLDESELAEITSGEKVTALTFDNVIRFKSPVALKQLRDIGCVDGSNAVTSRAMTSAQLQQIVSGGFGKHD